MRIVAGAPPTGSDFYKGRLPVVERLRELVSEKDVLILGPRRTGKTSIIKELIRLSEEQDENFKAIYINLESTKNVYDFYLRVIRETLEKCSKWKLKYKDGTDFLKNLSDSLNEIFDGKIDPSALLDPTLGASVTIKFPKFDPKTVEALRKELKNTLLNIPEPLLIVLDEFPELIWKLGTDEDHGGPEAQKAVRTEQTSFLLAGMRTLRQECDNGKNKHKVIIAGSVNLDNTLQYLGLSSHINDLERLKVSNLSMDQACELFTQLSEAEKFSFKEGFDYLDFIKSQFGSCTPFYIQVFAEILRQRLFDNLEKKEFDISDFEACFHELLLLPKGPSYLLERIDKYYNPKEQRWVKKALKVVANNQFTKDSSTTEVEIVEFANMGEKNPLERFEQTDIFAKMIADDIIQTSSSAAGSYEFKSRILTNFWYYNLVGTKFLNENTTKN